MTTKNLKNVSFYDNLQAYRKFLWQVLFYILLILSVCVSYKVEQKFFFLFQRINVNQMREQESCLKTCQSIFYYYYYNLVLPHLSFLRHHGSPKIVKRPSFFPNFQRKMMSVKSDMKKKLHKHRMWSFKSKTQILYAITNFFNGADNILFFETDYM